METGFSSGRKTTESSKYTGLGTFTIKAVAPTHAELKELWGEDARELKNHHVNDNGKDMGILNLLFNLQLPDGGEKILKESLFITNEFTKSQSGKLEVINEYGENAWVTEEEFKGNKKPAYSSDYLLPYRAAFKGETALIGFIKTFLGIPMTKKFKDNKFYPKTKEELQECKASFSTDSIAKFVKGDFSELRDVLGLQPDNKIKMFLGVNVTEKGAFQRINLGLPFSGSTKNLDKALDKLNKERDYHKDVVYDYEDTQVKVWSENFTSNPSAESVVDNSPSVGFNDGLPF